MMHTDSIQTDRLILKPINPAIVSHLLATETPDAIKAFFQFEESDLQALKSMHEKGLETFRITQHYFLLVEKTTGKVIGECGFHTWNTTHHRAEIFYNLRHDSDKQKGYMTEALHKVLDYGFGTLGLHRIQALVAYNNVPSLKLLEKYRFTKEGTAREDYLVNGVYEDSDCYSLLQHEWRKSAQPHQINTNP